MSWFLLTILLVIGGFLIAYGFCEWFVARRDSRSDGDDGRAPG